TTEPVGIVVAGRDECRDAQETGSSTHAKLLRLALLPMCTGRARAAQRVHKEVETEPLQRARLLGMGLGWANERMQPAHLSRALPRENLLSDGVIRAHPAGVGMHSPPSSICALVRNVFSDSQFGNTSCGIVPSSRTLVTKYAC